MSLMTMSRTNQIQITWGQCYKKISSSLKLRTNKLECLSLVGSFKPSVTFASKAVNYLVLVFPWVGAYQAFSSQSNFCWQESLP
jgi:hypothetical protein